jgi:predicted  nucleic acid-binding Zn-ribbon protein
VNVLKDKIGDLIVLQDCDNRIREIMNKKNEGPLKIKKLAEDLDAIARKFQEKNDRLNLLKKDARKIDQEIQGLEEQVEKSNIKLSLIKSNKEYKAALKEIEDLKHVKFQTEDKAIQVMEEMEELEKTCHENKEEEVGLRKAFERDKEEIERELEALEEELKILDAKRDTFVHAIDQDLLRKYLYLKDHKAGQAISPVLGGICQMCHMNIPPQTFNELIRGDSLMTCTNCNRIIYWAEDEHFQKALNRA